MLKRSAFIEILVKRFVRASRISAVHPPQILPLPELGRRESGQALNVFPIGARKRLSAATTERRRVSAKSTVTSHSKSAAVRNARARSLVLRSSSVWTAVLILLLAIFSTFAPAAVREVGPVGLTVGDLDRELMFYTNTLPFELLSISQTSGPDQDVLLGLNGVKLRAAELRLGDERFVLTQHLGTKGKPIPADSRSYDHWFQHIAIVVSDMEEAYEQLRRHKVKHVSTDPQTLPAWNQGAAGIKAFYFRDPEDHVLEIIWFPPGKGDPRWQSASRSTLNAQRSTLFLGIDHTAIVVSDTEKSLAFYRGLLGLRVAGESENYGVEQEHLNQVFGARLHITGLRAEHGPGIEFLEYITPPGGRDLPADAKSNDLIFWDTHLVVDDVSKMSAKFRDNGVVFVSRRGSMSSQIVRDPDGHAIRLDGPSAIATVSAPQ
jgi:catechol 2,3-dioxygenase-like lactoylglutathione lyase family enzyme